MVANKLGNDPLEVSLILVWLTGKKRVGDARYEEFVGPFLIFRQVFAVKVEHGFAILMGERGLVAMAVVEAGAFDDKGI